mmetsp:Transcript_103510/g.259510  ORF Transcript_103510/g.259510 Transcript_103510/m.259510 type:complete len:361 (-) Transcript_103510:60-1142(-)
MGQGNSNTVSEAKDDIEKEEPVDPPPPPPPPTDQLVLHGIRWPSHIRSEAQINAFRAVPCLSDDVFVAAYPRCGTHWVHKLCQLILKREAFDWPMEFNEWEKGLEWQGKGAGKGGIKHEEIPTPRILSTHSPLDFLPKEAESKGCRIIYVVREPKDVLISSHLFAEMNPFMEAPESLDLDIDRFVAEASADPVVATEGGGVLGGYAHHVLEYVKAARAGRNVHLMSYDRLHVQTDAEISSLAMFLGVTLSDDEVTSIRKQASFDVMKEEAKSKDEELSGWFNGVESKDGKGWSDMIWRGGRQGDGEKNLSPEQAMRIDEAYSPAFEAVKDVFEVFPSSPSFARLRGAASCCCTSRSTNIK